MKINNMNILINTEFLEENKMKKTTSRDLMSPEQSKSVPKKEYKKIGFRKNDIIERTEQKVITEDGRELLT